jgi:2-methylcitrate dehydratase PrpD
MDRVEIHIYLNAINIAGKVITPKTSEESKFSIHYSLATALLKGHFDLDDLPVENVTEEVKALIGKIVFVEDETMENRKAGIRGSRVVVYTKDGATLEQTVLIPKGDASNPMTPAEMRAKFAACAGGLLSCEQQERLIREVDRFEDITAYASINSFIK